MAIVKIIIFLLTVVLLLCAKLVEDYDCLRILIASLVSISTFFIVEAVFFNAYSIPNMLFMIGVTIVICNLGELKNIIKYAVPFIFGAITLYIV